MLDTISAHVKLIQGNNILREVVSNTIIRTKLTADRFLRRQQISGVNMQFFPVLIGRIGFPLYYSLNPGNPSIAYARTGQESAPTIGSGE